MKKWLLKISRLEIVLIFLVILAGSIVRTTGSGMGCPDWPKCFGHLIPPTERSELTWQPGQFYQKDQIIIRQQALYQALADFTTGQQYHERHWKAYTKHDYAQFNARHTWIEYINRLLGALSGLPMLALVVLSVFYWREDRRPLLLSVAGLFMLGFEAWLGKLVVDGNLIPGSITIHMLGSMVILALLLVLHGLLGEKRLEATYFTPLVRSALLLLLALVLLQILLGTQVREQIDTFLKMNLPRHSWMQRVDWVFYVHRSFSLLVAALAGWLWYQNWKRELGFWEFRPILLLVAAEIILGIVLAYFELPAWSQPLHLLLGIGLFAFCFQAVVHHYLAPRHQIIPVRS